MFLDTILSVQHKADFGAPMKRNVLVIPALFLLLMTASVSSQQTTAPTDPTLLTVDSIFAYRTKSLGPVRWTADGRGYLALEPSPTRKEFVDIIRYDLTTGNRTILVSAEKLTPTGGSAPLLVEEFDLSHDEQKLLIFTNSRSEEHTSELQSLAYLVCRLLLE